MGVCMKCLRKNFTPSEGLPSWNKDFTSLLTILCCIRSYTQSTLWHNCKTSCCAHCWYLIIDFLASSARDRTISPADLQGILGMIAHDQRTGFRGLPSLFPGSSGRGPPRQVLIMNCQCSCPYCRELKQSWR